MNVIIAIGYDNARDPYTFREQVDTVISRLGTVHAMIEGESFSEQWGTEGAAWFAAEFPNFDTFVEARARILTVGAVHNQDAIAFTFGTTDVAACPTRHEVRYRDFL